MDIFENISNDIQSHYSNIENFLNVELKEGIDKMNKETIDVLLNIVKHTENIPNNFFDAFRDKSTETNVYNPFSD